MAFRHRGLPWVLLLLSLAFMGAKRDRPLPGNAEVLTADEGSWSRERFGAIAEFSRNCELSAASWKEVATGLDTQARKRFGVLKPEERFWLAASWWATHQPRQHLVRPRWAKFTALNPNLTLQHPEGGNCESSANGFASLVSHLGLPSEPVYGYHYGANEPHVWTVTDVAGAPVLADIHLMRGSQWNPRPEHIMTAPTWEAAERFMADRRTDNPGQDPRGERPRPPNRR